MRILFPHMKLTSGVRMYVHTHPTGKLPLPCRRLSHSAPRGCARLPPRTHELPPRVPRDHDAPFISPRPQAAPRRCYRADDSRAVTVLYAGAAWPAAHTTPGAVLARRLYTRVTPRRSTRIADARTDWPRFSVQCMGQHFPSITD